MIFALCLALFAGASWARGTTVGIGETIPVGGTTTTTTTTTNTTTTTTEDSGSSEPTPQMQITPADGGEAGSTEGSGWENLGVMGGSGSGNESTGGDSSGAGNGQPQPDGNGEDRTGNSCAPAFVLAGMALALFVFRN